MGPASLLLALLAAAAAEGGGGRSITSVDFMLTLTTVVLFALFASVLARFGWKPLLRAIEEREKGVREAVEGAGRANAEAQELLAQHKEMVKEAGQRRDEVIKAALHDAEQLRADLAERARSEAERMVASARQQIERETRQAVAELRGQVADLAMAAAAKIVASSLTPEAQRRLVDEFVESVGKPPGN
jgi:F-type H+-transporting ATPase subunit b